MKIDGEFADGELLKLCELLELLDQKLCVIQTSRNPDSDGLCDTGEYFIGVGFAAIQQYLVDTLLFTGLDKRDAFKLGPFHSEGITFIDLFNSAANWWKHEAEWFNKGEVPKIGENTFNHVKIIAKSEGYELSNVLASICGSSNLSLAAVVPYLKEWRADVQEVRKHKP
jgi:hypothetical protein